MNNTHHQSVVLIGTEIGSTLNFRGTLIKRLISNGYTVYVFATNYDDSSKEKVRALDAIPVDSPLNRASMNPLADIIGCYKLSKILKNLKPISVLSFFSKPVIFGSLAAKMAGVPRVVSMLEGLGHFFYKRPVPDGFKTHVIKFIQIFLYRISFLCVDLLILLNPDDEKNLVRRYKLKVADVKILGGIGVEIDRFPLVESVLSPIEFLFVGRMIFNKGIREFIEAAYRVKAYYPNALFKIVGDCDPENPSSLSQNDKERIMNEGIVEITGFQPNVAETIVRSSVFVLPSYGEGVPLSVQEAMAMGRPIITTTTPGCLGVIEEGISGYYVPPFDVNALAEKMCAFCEEPSRIKIMGQKAHERALKIFDRNEKDVVLMDWVLG